MIRREYSHFGGSVKQESRFSSDRGKTGFLLHATANIIFSTRRHKSLFNKALAGNGSGKIRQRVKKVKKDLTERVF
jgi:hypothetical protein